MAYSVHGIVNGPIVGLFTLGMLLPFVNGWVSEKAKCVLLPLSSQSLWLCLPARFAGLLN